MQRQWNPPSHRMCKINVDAAISSASNSAGIGVGREGLILAWERGFREVFLGGDARTFYKMH